MAGETPLTIVGNLTAAPELRFTQGGDAVCNFTVASTPRRYDKASNAWVDGEPLFLRCSAWRRQAENAAESLEKGDRVVVTGHLVQRSYTDREGQNRTVFEVQVEEIGASLVFRSIKHGTPSATRGAQPAEDDPWATSGYQDEPPF